MTTGKKTTLEIHEPGRGRVLPGPRDIHTVVSTWNAHLCCNADLRTTHQAWQDLAAYLTVTHVTSEEHQ